MIEDLKVRGRETFCSLAAPALIVFCITFLSDLPACAQAVASKEPSSTHIFPAGGRRGTVVPVRIGAECLPPGANLRVWGEGVRGPDKLGSRAGVHGEPSASRLPLDANAITYPKEWESQLEVDANAPLGTKLWRLTCGWGGAQVRPFLVGDLAEFIETEPNSTPARAERVQLPITVNGQIYGERDVDFYVFSANAGDVIVCDVLAARLGSPLEPVIEVRDPEGRRVAGQEVRIENDAVLAIRARTSGDYTLNIANVGFRGGPEQVYRLTLSTAPYVPFAFPPGGRAGDQPLVKLFALTGTSEFRTWDEPVPLVAARAGVFQFHSAAAVGSSVALEVGDLPEVVMGGEHRTKGSALDVALPVTINGCLMRAESEDWCRLSVRTAGTYSLVCRPVPASSAALPIVTLEDADGKLVAQGSALEAPDHQCRFDWTAPAEGVYRVRVRDQQQGVRGGPEFLYRMSIRPADPDFSLSLTADFINVTQGAKGEVELIVRRSGGFTGPIDLAWSGLPAGVQIEPAQIPENQPRIKLSVSVPEDARPADATLQIVGTAQLAGEKRNRIARVRPAGVEAGTEALQLTIQHKPIFQLTCNEAYQYGHRGTIYRYPVQIQRLNGFTGPITLQIADRQAQDLDGIEVPEIVVPPGVSEVRVPIYLPETMHANVQHHCRPYVQGHAVFTDKWGQELSMLALSDKRCMIRSMPPVVKLKAVDPVLAARIAETVPCRLELERTSNFMGPMQIELIEPAPASGVSAAKFHVDAGQSSALVPVQFAAASSLPSGTTLKFRATGNLAGDILVVSEATVALKMPVAE